MLQRTREQLPEFMGARSLNLALKRNSQVAGDFVQIAIQFQDRLTKKIHNEVVFGDIRKATDFYNRVSGRAELPKRQYSVSDY